MTTFVNVTDTLKEMRAQLVNAHEYDRQTYARLESKYFSPDTPIEWCINARPVIKRLEKDLSTRADAITHIEEALCILSNGEYKFDYGKEYTLNN